jgi:hypothetical protein
MAAAGALAASSVARADTRPRVKLAKFFPYLDLYLALPPAQRSLFALAYFVYRDRRPAPDVKAYVIEPNGQRRPIGLDRSGRIVALPSLGELHGPGEVEIDAPASEKIGVGLQIEARFAPATSLDVHQLQVALAQANTAIAKNAGLLSFAVPKLTCVYLLDAGSGRAVLADGRTVGLPVDTGRPYPGAPYLDTAAVSNARTITLARLPSHIMLAGGPR